MPTTDPEKGGITDNYMIDEPTTHQNFSQRYEAQLNRHLREFGSTYEENNSTPVEARQWLPAKHNRKKWIAIGALLLATLIFATVMGVIFNEGRTEGTTKADVKVASIESASLQPSTMGTVGTSGSAFTSSSAFRSTVLPRSSLVATHSSTSLDATLTARSSVPTWTVASITAPSAIPTTATVTQVFTALTSLTEISAIKMTQTLQITKTESKTRTDVVTVSVSSSHGSASPTGTSDRSWSTIFTATTTTTIATTIAAQHSGGATTAITTLSGWLGHCGAPGSPC